MKSAITKIDRRIADLEEFDTNSIADRSDPRIDSLEKKLDELLVSIFGNDTVEYARYKWSVTNIDTAAMYMGHPTPISEIREGLQRGKGTSLENLRTIREGFIENLEDAWATSSGKALKAYDGLELHPAIEKNVGKLFRDGHYSNAVEDAVKCLNALVRMQSGIDDKDGTGLMEFVFAPKNPVLKVNELKDDSDRDEQRGFMMLFSGAVAGLRNPRAHKIIKDDPGMALEFIAFISLLAKFAEKSEKA